MLLEKMAERKLECSFIVGSQEYRVNFATMIQANTATGSQREIRCRPAYRSPESMRPYLQLVFRTVSLSL